jgi:hypothetical protein
MRHPERPCLLLFLLLATPALAHAAGVEETLNSRWRGGFVVVRMPISSNCDGFYNDNNVVGDRTDSKARRRFEAGELARVERIGVKRGRVDVFLDIAEGVLQEIHDGPFTLYEPKTCKLQLRVPVPNGKDAAGIEARLGELLEHHETAREAEASSGWNGRRREAFPEDYDRTLAAYESYKAERRNAAVQELMDEAAEETSRITSRMRSNPDYMTGFSEGVKEVRNHSYGNCESLLSSSFSPDTRSGQSSNWDRGYEDGQRLTYNGELFRRLKSCFVPVPPAPD